MIIKDFIRQMCVPLENGAYFGDGDGFKSNPVKWLRNYGTWSMWHHYTWQGNMGNHMKKIFFTFDFHILPEQRHIGSVHHGVGEKLSWVIRQLSDGVYLFYIDLWDLPSDIRT